jgi:hypothetical protein
MAGSRVVVTNQNNVMGFAEAFEHVTAFTDGTGTKGEYMHSTLGKNAPTNTNNKESPGVWYCPRLISIMAILQDTGSCVIHNSSYWCGFSQLPFINFHATEWLTENSIKFLKEKGLFTAAEFDLKLPRGDSIAVKFVFDIVADNEEDAIHQLFRAFADLPNWLHTILSSGSWKKFRASTKRPTRPSSNSN